MRRRGFFKLTGLFLGERLATASPDNTQDPSLLTISAQRSTSLFNAAFGSPDTAGYVAQLGSGIVCIHGDVMRQSLKITASGSDGATLWEYALPQGFYSSAGGDVEGDSVMLHAPAYRSVGGKYHKHCIISLSTRNGAITEVGSMTIAGTGAMSTFIGAKSFLRFSGSRAEAWSLGSQLSLAASSVAEVQLDQGMREVISPTEAALLPATAASLSMVAFPTAVVATVPVTGPEIASAQAIIADVFNKRAMEPLRTVMSSVVAVTGSDAVRGLVYALIYSAPGAPVVAIDRGGVAATAGRFALRKKSTPVKLLRSATELGVAYSDGAVDWFPLAG